MYLLPGVVEEERAVQCMHKNPESLCFDPLHQTAPGESAVFNNKGNELTLKAKKLEDLEQLLQKVEFAADAPPKGYSRPGERLISIETHVECMEGNKSIPLGRREVTVSVQKARGEQEAEPHLFVSGRNMLSVDQRGLKVGAAMLPDLQITVTESGGML